MRLKLEMFRPIGSNEVAMNRVYMIPTLAVLTLHFLSCAEAADHRMLFDEGWRFSRGDFANAQTAVFDDSSWRTLRLPHDWSIELPTKPSAPSGAGGGYFQTGVGWYRKHFSAPEQWENKQIWLEFGGVYQKSEVWLNGTRVGRHAYGYTPFRIDLSEAMKVGEQNTLAIRVDNSQQPSCRWYSGSGIYRHVWLNLLPKVHIVPDSTQVQVESLEAGRASLRLVSQVRNVSGESQDLAAEFTLFGPESEVLQDFEVQLEAKSGEASRLERTVFIESPRPWSPEKPDLHTLRTRLHLGGHVVHQSVTPFGIRTVEVDSERGLLLNGQPIRLFGGNVHHDNGPLGAAAQDRAEVRRVELLKAAGFNAVRTSHNPPSVAFLDACDRLGMLVMDEAFDGWGKAKVDHDYSELFDDNWRDDLLAMVLRDRNHPSIVMWSIGNEMYERGDPQAVEMARDMVDLIRQHDTTRPVVAGINGLGPEGWNKLDPLFAQLDIAGYNYESTRVAQDKTRVPERVMLSTESYANAAEESWRTTEIRPYFVGDFVWTAMDYLGESGIGRVFPPGEEVVPHWVGSHYPWHGATCGDIDVTGFRKPISHFRNIIWNRGEKLYAAVVKPTPSGGDWNLSRWAVLPTVASWTWPGQEGKPLEVEVYSRYPRVRVKLNGTQVDEFELGVSNGFHATIPVRYQPGELEVLGIDENGAIQERYQLKTANQPAQILLNADREKLVADGCDLSFVHVHIADQAGRVCPTATHYVKYRLEGPGEIIAIGSGDLASREPYAANPRRVFEGRALVVIRSTETAGEITLHASSEGLPVQTIRVTSREK